MKNTNFLKHDISSLGNCKLKALLAAEGMKGYGAYWILIEVLCEYPDFRAPVSRIHELTALYHVRASFWVTLILKYGLFKIEGDFFYSPGLLRRMKPYLNKKQAAETECENTSLKTMEQERSEAEKPSLNVKPTVKPNVKEVSRCEDKTLKNSDKQPPRVREDILRLNKINNNKENIAVVADPLSSGNEPPKQERGAVLSPDHERIVRMGACRPWQKLVDEMATDNEFLQRATGRSGLDGLLTAHKEEMIDFFRQHILLYDKGTELLFLSDVKRYFVNFTAPGCRTADRLAGHLEQKRREEKRRGTLSPYETMANGQRMYGAWTIPEYAPPRPNDSMVWNDYSRKWER